MSKAIFPDKISVKQYNFAILGYLIPVIGWMIPLYLDPKNSYCQFHGKQSLMITFYCGFLVALWWILDRFIPLNYNFIGKYTLYGIGGFYILSLVSGIVTAIGKWKLPFFGKRADKCYL